MGYRIEVPAKPKQTAGFDIIGTVLSAVGLVLVVIGVLISRTYGWFVSRTDAHIGNTVVIPKGSVSPVWVFIVAGCLVLAWFYWHARAWEREGKQPLLSTRLFHNRTSNLGLVTQNMQWLVMQGTFFVVSVFLQEVRGFSAIKTGLVLTGATAGILLSSVLAERMARRHPQRTLVELGFVVTIIGMVELLLFARATSSIWTFVPGLFLIGIGVGVMLTASVNVVQSAFPEKDQGEISGLSRSISNLGSSLGTAIAGSVLVSTLTTGNRLFALALASITAFAAVGLIAAVLLPRQAWAPISLVRRQLHVTRGTARRSHPRRGGAQSPEKGRSSPKRASAPDGLALWRSEARAYPSERRRFRNGQVNGCQREVDGHCP